MSIQTPHLAIFGPTASGKTALAHEYAFQLQANILSTDSRQLYQDMNVVTGKDIPSTAQAMILKLSAEKTLPAWKLSHAGMLLGHDLTAPDQEFSIAHFYSIVENILTAKPFLNDQRWILCGGAWQYLSVLFDPPASLFVPQDQTWRERASTLEIDELQNKLKVLNPEYWNTLNNSDQNNPRRLVRAVEIAHYNHVHSASEPQPLFHPQDITFVVLNPPKATLKQAISQRVLERWNHGALEETQQLMNTYPVWNTPAFESTGYAYIRQYLEGKLTSQETLERWTAQEVDYAQRQQTWIRSLPQRYPQLKLQIFESIQHIDPEFLHQ